MKFVFSLLVLVSVNANASAFLHDCTVKNSDSDIVKVEVARNRGAINETISVFYKDETVDSVSAEYYNDMTFIGYASLDKKFNLLLDQVNEDGVWTEGVFYYGDLQENELKVICQ